MAKTIKVETHKEFEGNILVSQEFNTLMTINQIGDQFYVPNADYIFVMGTKVPAQNGRPERQAGQRFVAVRVINGEPFEAVELYVGQLVKVDVRGRIVFPGVLADSLRQGDAAFKKTICGQFLEIVDEQQIEDRVWDNEQQAYLRDEDGKFVRQTKPALKFDVKVRPSKFDVNKANEIIVNYIEQSYPECVNEK